MNTFNLTLDLDKEQGLPHLVTLRQGDKSGTQLVATIYDHGQLVSGSYTARVSLRHPGSGDTYYRETATYSNGVATVTIDEQYAATVAGVTTGYFELLQGSTVKASTADFIVRILPSAEDGAVPGSVYDSAIEDALAELDAATGRISQMVVDATAEYLAAHPEITTTVQDNSVTDAKLIQSGGVLDRVGRLWWRLENLLTNTPAEAESVTVSDAAKTPVAGLTVFGKSTQDGTPTPDAPVAIQSVTPNLADTTNVFNGYFTSAGSIVASSGHRIVYIPCKPNVTYYLSKVTVTRYDRFVIGESTAVPTDGGSCSHVDIVMGADSDNMVGKRLKRAYTTSTTAKYLLVWAGTGVTFADVQLAVYESEGYEYVPLGYAGLWARGRNLLDLSSALDTVTLNGVTFTRQADGSYKGSGTATAAADVYIANGWFTALCNLDAGKTYHFHALSAAKAGVRVTLRANDLSDTSYPTVKYFNDTNGAGESYTPSKDGIAAIALYVNVASGTNVDGLVIRPQLELGTTATAFEPYAESVTSVPLDGHVLRSLPDGTRDEVTVDQYGHVTLVQRVGVDVWDGSSDESWRAYDYTSGGGFYITGSALPYPRNNTYLRSRVMCTSFPFGGGPSSGDNTFYFTLYDGTQNYICSSVSGVDAWREYLAEHPITIIYELKEPVTNDLGTIDPTALVGPDLNAQAVPTAPFELTYERDLNTTLARLEAAIAALA